MNLAKHLESKALALQAKSEGRREIFAFIGALGLCYKANFLTKQQVADILNQAKVTREELRSFREQSSRCLHG
jgi:hypothetical protein